MAGWAGRIASSQSVTVLVASDVEAQSISSEEAHMQSVRLPKRSVLARRNLNLSQERSEQMSPQIKLIVSAVTLVILGFVSPLLGQQKGQWVPGQFGLNAGVIPDPGITYANLALNYSASHVNDSNGNKLLQNVTGT
jgi:hypothetical protein